MPLDLLDLPLCRIEDYIAVPLHPGEVLDVYVDSPGHQYPSLL